MWASFLSFSGVKLLNLTNLIVDNPIQSAIESIGRTIRSTITCSSLNSKLLNEPNWKFEKHTTAPFALSPHMPLFSGRAHTTALGYQSYYHSAFLYLLTNLNINNYITSSANTSFSSPWFSSGWPTVRANCNFRLTMMRFPRHSLFADPTVLHRLHIPLMSISGWIHQDHLRHSDRRV